jgi:RNA polymerase sigma factor (sigma-70 family)
VGRRFDPDRAHKIEMTGNKAFPNPILSLRQIFSFNAPQHLLPFGVLLSRGVKTLAHRKREIKVSLRKKAQAPATVAAWSVSDLSALYTQNRSSLIAQARRILRSDADAAEVVQDAFLKFILAAPELDTADRAMAYLRTTVNNLCLNVIRATGSRPNLVAIDSDATQERLSEIAAENHIPMDATLAAAEDASIIREALSRLSKTQRTALVMWEVEGRTTKEIATAIGTSEKNVRHVVQRARASFIRVLTEWVVDEKTGATALDSISGTYKKAAELAKKSSKVALSLLIVMVAFLGFNSVTGSEFNNGSLVSTFTQEAPASVQSSPSSLPDTNIDLSNQKFIEDNSAINFRTSKSLFAGLSKDGLPTGFTVSDTTGNVGSLFVSSQSTITNPDGYVLVSYAQSLGESTLNALFSQTITVDGAGTSYFASPSVTVAGSWFPLTQTGSASAITRLSNGNYLLTATIYIDSTVDSALFVAATGGLDVDAIPNEITTRIILNSSKSSILAQAINIGAKGVK